jgi:hypothetical protein
MAAADAETTDDGTAEEATEEEHTTPDAEIELLDSLMVVTRTEVLQQLVNQPPKRIQERCTLISRTCSVT